MSDFKLVHAVVDKQGKLLRLESEQGNCFFVVTEQESNTFKTCATDISVDMSDLRTHINQKFASC